MSLRTAYATMVALCALGSVTSTAIAALVDADPSAGCSAAPRPAASGESRQVSVAGEQRAYPLDAPATSDRPLPVVLSFHGFRGSAENLRRGDGFGAVAAREGFIVIHPEGHDGVRLLGTIGRGWDLGPHDARDVALVQALLDDLERERCVDRRRVYATGMSNGGFFASLVGCKLADRVAAVAPVAGVMALDPCTPARPIPVLLIFGRADDVVPPALMRGGRDWWARTEHCTASTKHDGCTAYTGCAADVVACEGPQAHAWPADATDRIWRFFREHPRADR